MHDFIADIMNSDRTSVKVEHLSIFNKKITQMEKNPVWNVWATQFPEMAELIIKDKEDNGHKFTSRILFKLETNIMANVVVKLNDLNIPGIYVYDAIYTTMDISDIMIETSIELNITGLTVKKESVR
jgi:hypothetical protein